MLSLVLIPFPPSESTPDKSRNRTSQVLELHVDDYGVRTLAVSSWMAGAFIGH